jgi:hypothetical protein
MRNGECGLRNKTPPWPENPEFFIPNSAICILLSCSIATGSVKNEFTKECQLI